MPARVPAPPESPWARKAILCLDPAGVGDIGLAARLTVKLPKNPARGKLPAPDWTYQGGVWNDAMYDDLGVWLAKNVGRTGPVLFVVDNTAFGGMHIARSIGTAIGAMRGFLVGTGWIAPDDKPLSLSGQTWRSVAFPAERPKGRAAQKAAAMDRVKLLYGYGANLQDDMAEAVLMNDFVVAEMPEVWQ